MALESPACGPTGYRARYLVHTSFETLGSPIPVSFPCPGTALTYQGSSVAFRPLARPRYLKLAQGYTDEQLPEDIEQTGDPVEVFASAGTVSPDLAARVEAEMTDLEVAATASAKPIRLARAELRP